MTRSAIKNALSDLNKLVLEGNMMDAFDKYYHDNVSMQENDLAPTVSKATNRLRELEFLGNITEFRHAAIQGTAVIDNVSIVIWKYDYTHKEWGIRNYTQVSIQQWQDDKIIKEKFIYND